MKNQKMPEFANNMGWIFSGTKTKRSTRLTRETRSTWNYRLNFNNRSQEYSSKTSWFYSKNCLAASHGL